MIYLSTGGFQNLAPQSVIQKFNEQGIKSIELSGGKYEKSYFKKIIKIGKSSNLMIHNYFPYYKNPFVFNLASQDKKIIDKSLKMAIAAININHKLKNKF